MWTWFRSALCTRDINSPGSAVHWLYFVVYSTWMGTYDIQTWFSSARHTRDIKSPCSAVHYIFLVYSTGLGTYNTWTLLDSPHWTVGINSPIPLINAICWNSVKCAQYFCATWRTHINDDAGAMSPTAHNCGFHIWRNLSDLCGNISEIINWPHFGSSTSYPRSVNAKIQIVTHSWFGVCHVGSFRLATAYLLFCISKGSPRLSMCFQCVKFC